MNAIVILATMIIVLAVAAWFVVKILEIYAWKAVRQLAVDLRKEDQVWYTKAEIMARLPDWSLMFFDKALLCLVDDGYLCPETDLTEPQGDVYDKTAAPFIDTKVPISSRFRVSPGMGAHG